MPWYTHADAVRDAEKQKARWVTAGFGDCPICSADVEIFTDGDGAKGFYDGDPARCMECGHAGQFDCDAESPGQINWHE